ncbi:MAG: hypothetical protein V7731_05750 [Amphritea sp.]
MRREFEIFNLSFLDIISCGFGAVVLLVLISNTSDQEPSSELNAVTDLLRNVFMAEARLADLSKALDSAEQQLAEYSRNKEVLNVEQQQIQKKLSAKEGLSVQLQNDSKSLELIQASLKRTSTPISTTNKRDIEVGGIPVDSDYVIFIIDTSGSMKNIWGRVIRELENILDIHPQVKGFQILNDNGSYLISAYVGKWIKDTPKRRKNVIDALRQWNKASNSSPVEGLEVALKTYAKAGASLSIYIFGDDYTGSSYDKVINSLSRLNTNRINGKTLAKVHGVGFLSNQSANRFSILMREVTRRNGGTFLALPR